MAIKNIKFGSPIYAPKAIFDNITVKGTSTIENSTEIVIKDALIVVNPEGEAAEATLLGQVILTGKKIGQDSENLISGTWVLEADKVRASTTDISQEFTDCYSGWGECSEVYNSSEIFVVYRSFMGEDFYYKSQEEPGSSISLRFNTPNEVSPEFMEWIQSVGHQSKEYVFPEEAYGVLYDPAEDTIKLGLGAYNAETGLFEYSENEGHSIAVRDLTDNDDGALVVWNAAKACLEAAPVKVQGDKSLVTGDHNSVSEISKSSIIGGISNTLNGHKTIMSGGNNVADQTDLAIIAGSENTVIGDANIVAGRENSVTVSRSNLVVGHRNKVGTEFDPNAPGAPGETPDGTIDGANNTIGGNLVGGHGNVITGSDNIVAGKGNESGLSNAIIAGQYIAPIENALLILGNGSKEEGLAPVKSNAFYVTTDGKAYIAGDKILSTEEYVNSKATSLSNDIQQVSAQIAASYVAKETGKGLSQHNFTDTYKAYIDGNLGDVVTSPTGSIIAGNGNAGASVQNTAVFGQSNEDYAGHNVIGGKSNVVSTDLNTVGGSGNTVSGVANIVGGRDGSVASRGNILGGVGNKITGVNTSNDFGGNIIGGQSNTIEGLANVDNGSSNLVIGRGNTITGSRNLVCGSVNTVAGTNSICGGSNNTVNGIGSLVAGSYCIADGSASFVMGRKMPTDRGDESIDSGNVPTQAHSSSCFAFGGGVENYAEWSAAFGYGTVSTEKVQFVVGRYNVLSQTDPENYDKNGLTTQLFIVGNGSKTGGRSNAFHVTDNGEAYVKNTKRLATEEYVQQAIAEALAKIANAEGGSY